ncbi:MULTISPECIES: DMT family transporter [Paenibacillus]|uniref:DMT family transporter n=1 Tax=Paenibacillus TaxID=44249 RepID=UPI002040C668|nr:DMT family transporter [Paenibacillus camelliae]
MNKKVLIGAFLCLVASMSWGAMFPVAHVALMHIDPFYFSFIRYLIVGIILSVILFIKEGKQAFRLEGKGLSLLFYGSMAFVVYNMFIFFGQQQMGKAGTIIASIMEVLMPMISIILIWVTTRKKPGAATLRNVLIAFIGAVLVITRGDLSFFAMNSSQLMPLLFMLIGVTGWVVYSLGGSRFKEWSILRYSTLTCLIGNAAALLIVTTGTMAGWLQVPTMETLFTIKYEMAFMSLLPGLVALLSWNKGLQMLSSTHGLLFINFVPITTFVIIAIQGYSINAFEIVGTLLIIAAIARNTLNQGSSTGKKQLPIKLTKALRTLTSKLH